MDAAESLGAAGGGGVSDRNSCASLISALQAGPAAADSLHDSFSGSTELRMFKMQMETKLDAILVHVKQIAQETQSSNRAIEQLVPTKKSDGLTLPSDQSFRGSMDRLRPRIASQGGSNRGSCMSHGGSRGSVLNDTGDEQASLASLARRSSKGGSAIPPMPMRRSLEQINAMRFEEEQRTSYVPSVPSPGSFRKQGSAPLHPHPQGQGDEGRRRTLCRARGATMGDFSGFCRSRVPDE